MISISLILFLQKGIYPYEYMDDWKKVNETLLSGKEAFYSNLNKKDVTDTDYAHGKRVCKIKKLGDCHDLHCMFKAIHYC